MEVIYLGRVVEKFKNDVRFCGGKSTRPNFKEIKEQMSKRPQINKRQKT